jgi:TetR/AcrR family transcriptional regulator, transcriptional repressor for nem operon
MNEAASTAQPATKKGEETRERILAAATELIHQRGYNATGLSEIVAASGVPKGSFYFYFASKEELGRVLLQRYRAKQAEELALIFPEDAPAIPTIRGFFEHAVRMQADSGCKSGCLLGNLAAEITESEDLRKELEGVLSDLQQALAGAVRRGQERAELARDFSPESAADFFLSVFEGSILLAKARRDPQALEASLAMLVRYLETLRQKAASNPPAGKEGRA